jgi:GT2 family glycosyltransferase
VLVERSPQANGPCPAIRSSIIIVSYNAVAKLLPCLRSVLASLPPDCEVIVIDNASSENNVSAIETEFPTVELLKSESNLGFGGGANLAAARARGEYLAFLNPDTIVECGWLDALVASLLKNEQAALATPQIVMTSEPEIVNTCGCDVHISGLATCRGLGRAREDYSIGGEVAAISGAAFVIRKRVFDLLGGFDDAMFLYMEDIDLSWRARLAGWHTLYVPESIVRHDYELKITRLKTFWQERNRYLMLLKSLRWPTLILLLPELLLAELVTIGFVVLRDRQNFGNKSKAVWWILSNWRLVLAKRRATQSLRRTSDRSLLRETGYRLEFTQVAAGLVPSLASLVFDPLFFAFRAITLAFVWW